MSTKKTLYSVAINGQGYLLARTPNNPSRKMSDVDQFGAVPTNVDMNFSDATQWLPWAQTDWSGGYQEEKWADNAAFKDGQNIEVFDKYGEVVLSKGVSAVKTNFASGHTFGSAIVANDNLVIGTNHSSIAHLWYFNSSDAATQITTGWTNITQVRDMAIYRDKVLLALKRSTGSEYTLQSYDFSSMANIRNTSAEVHTVKVIDDRIYISELSSAANGDTLLYSDDGGANWTTIITATGQNREIVKAVENYGTLYYLIADGHKCELWECVDVSTSKIFEFPFLLNPRLVVFNSSVYIAGEDEEGHLVIWEWTGGAIQLVFEETVSGQSISSLEPIVYRERLITQGLQFDGLFLAPTFNPSISGGSVLSPFIVFGGTATGVPYFYGTGSDGALDIYKLNRSGYATSGYITTGVFTASKPAIDKLWYSVELNFKTLASGESIKIEYSTDNEATWTTLDTVSYSTYGAISSKTLLFPTGTYSRKLQLKITLAGNGTSTPTFYDYVVRYKTFADEKYQWDLTLKCLDDMSLLDRESKEPKRGIELRNLLMVAKEKKSVVDFEDIDFWETLLNGAISSSATTITVDNTDNAPEQGMFRIDNEWITYTGKTATAFTGCERGARGTVGAAHLDNATVSNLYKVMLSSRGYDEITPIINDFGVYEMYVKVRLKEV